MRPSLLIAIDFDNTYTADRDTWHAVIQLLQCKGHRVICVSNRPNNAVHLLELHKALPKDVLILLSYGMTKREYAETHGFNVDIWIDDMPESIPTPQQLKAMCE